MTHHRVTDYVAEAIHVLLIILSLVVMFLSVTGCSSVLKDLPAGSNVQVSTTGFRVSPQAIDGPFIVGQSTYQLQTPTPEGSGPALNRTAVKATLTGVDIKSTVATGPVGEQIQAAGGAESLEVLLGDPSSAPSATEPELDAPASADE